MHRLCLFILALNSTFFSAKRDIHLGLDFLAGKTLEAEITSIRSKVEANNFNMDRLISLYRTESGSLL